MTRILSSVICDLPSSWFSFHSGMSYNLYGRFNVSLMNKAIGNHLLIPDHKCWNHCEGLYVPLLTLGLDLVEIQLTFLWAIVSYCWYSFWCRTPVWIAFSSGLVDSTAIPLQIRLLECVSDGGWLPDVWTGSRGWVSLTSKLTFTVYGRDASMGAWALCRELPATQYCWQALTVTCNTPFQTKNLKKAWFLHSLHLLDFWFWKSRDAGAMLDFIWCWQCCICIYLSRCTSTGLIPNLGHPLLLWRQLGM